MKAKLINGENSWRLEVEGTTYYFTNSSFAEFLSDTLSKAGYEVEIDEPEYVIGIDPSSGGTSIGHTLNTSILLESVDEELSSLEDITHGEIGNRITELRKKLK